MALFHSSNASDFRAATSGFGLDVFATVSPSRLFQQQLNSGNWSIALYDRQKDWASELLPTTQTIHSNNRDLTQFLFGTGLAISGGQVSAGQVSGWYVDQGDGLVMLAHADLAGRDVAAAAASETRADDLMILRQALAGDDLMILSNGNDYAQSHGGQDILGGNTGHDTLRGGSGGDMVLGGVGNDRLLGENGNDLLVGAQGQDHLIGGRGDDTLDGGLGRDTVTGGSGSDRFVFRGGDAAAVITDFGTGDRLVFAGDLERDDLTVARRGDDLILRIADMTITLQDVSRSALKERMMIFGDDPVTARFDAFLDGWSFA
ncbi:calcium-binding protein [Gemmobacter denitrificans]|uniref:Calcium-binding protein n=1 Tax=Gemmobacter denitrificans TaxID=3123040 RepID=A0ABU8BUG2_9RHOB